MANITASHTGLPGNTGFLGRVPRQADPRSFTTTATFAHPAGLTTTVNPIAPADPAATFSPAAGEVGGGDAVTFSPARTSKPRDKTVHRRQVIVHT